MSSVNKIILVGNLGKDPELKEMSNGDSLVRFSLATTETWKDKHGENQEKTEWHNIVMFRGLADNAKKYLQKGRKVYIEGKIEYRKYRDNNDIEKWTTDIIASDFRFLDSKEKDTTVINNRVSTCVDDDIPF